MVPGGGLAAAGPAGAAGGGVALGAGMALDGVLVGLSQPRGGGRLRDQPGETGSDVLVGQGEVPLLVMEPLSAVPASGWWPDTGNRHVRPVTFRPGGGAGRRTGSRC